MARKLKVNIVVPSAPVPKGRPRMTRRGRVFTPKRTLDAEAIIRDAWGSNPKFTGPVSLVVVFQKDQMTIEVTDFPEGESKLRGDIDNYVKTVMDGLNGVAWDDDRQVMYVAAYKQ